MTTEEKMTINDRRKYLCTMKTRYKKAGRKVKGQLLDEMEAVTGMHHKSLVRLMNDSLIRKRRRERGKIKPQSRRRKCGRKPHGSS